MKHIFLLLLSFILCFMLKAQTVTSTLSAIQDAYVSDASKNTTNNTGDIWLYDYYYYSQFEEFRGYIDFGELPVHTKFLTSAKLILQCTDSNDGDATIKIYNCPNSWNESTLTWNNQPSLTNSTHVTVPSQTGTPTYEIDITSLLKSENSYAACFYFILNQAGPESYNAVRFASSENGSVSKRPKLIIEYNEDPGFRVNYLCYDEHGSLSGDITQTIKYNLNASAVTAIPNNDFSFMGWKNASGETISLENPLTLKNITKDMDITAVFSPPSGKVIASAGEHGSITPSGLVSLSTSTMFTFIPDDGYVVSKVYVDYVAVPFYGNQYVMDDVDMTKGYSIRVEFKAFNNLLSVYPDKDAFIHMKEVTTNSKSVTNYGGLDNLSLWDSEWYARDYQQILIHFSGIKEALQKVGVNDIKSQIISVKLNLYHKPNSTSGHDGDNGFNVYQYNEEWNETEVTWNNATEIASGVPSVVVAKSTSSTQDYSIDVTDLIDDELLNNNGEAGFRLKLSTGAFNSNQNCLFASKEYEDVSYAPQLVFSIKDTPTSVSKEEYEKLSVYPNPTKGGIALQLLEGLQQADLSIYSLVGQLVYQDREFHGGKVDLSGLQKGIYLVKVTSSDRIGVVKLIKD